MRAKRAPLVALTCAFAAGPFLLPASAAVPGAAQEIRAVAGEPAFSQAELRGAMFAVENAILRKGALGSGVRLGSITVGDDAASIVLTMAYSDRMGGMPDPDVALRGVSEVPLRVRVVSEASIEAAFLGSR